MANTAKSTSSADTILVPAPEAKVPANDLKSVNDGKVTSRNSSHPVGTVVGTVAGAAAGIEGAIIAGAAAGMAVGPAGAAIGAAVGAVAGAMVGHTIAGEINPQTEDLFWRSNFTARPYVPAGSDYTLYQPAYMYGVDSFSQFKGKNFDDIEPQLGQKWDTVRGTSTLDWDIAREASRDAYNRLNKAGTR